MLFAIFPHEKGCSYVYIQRTNDTKLWYFNGHIQDIKNICRNSILLVTGINGNRFNFCFGSMLIIIQFYPKTKIIFFGNFDWCSFWPNAVCSAPTMVYPFAFIAIRYDTILKSLTSKYFIHFSAAMLKVVNIIILIKLKPPISRADPRKKTYGSLPECCEFRLLQEFQIINCKRLDTKNFGRSR